MCAWSFGDSFDCYAAPADALNGYWDSGTTVSSYSFVAGRFTGSQALSIGATNNTLIKTSGVNDVVHHIAVAFRQTTAITGSTLGLYLELFDGATAQCTIVFRSDGAVLLTSGGPAGTVLDTYTGAFPVTNTWYAFEFEVTISNTVGRFRVRKNGNTSDDYDSTAVRDTQNSANAYANKLQIGLQTAGVTHQFDDLFWRSDASSVAWLGDIRCFTRMPASDASVQFSRTPAVATQAIPSGGSIAVTAATTQSYYSSFIGTFDGTVTAITVTLNTGWTGNFKCSVFNGSATAVTTILASATTITNPVTGLNTFNFTPFVVSRGVQYWVGFAADVAQANAIQVTGTSAGGVGSANKQSATIGYATFPTASPTIVGGNGLVCSWLVSTAANYQMVNEPQQDATTSYVYDSTAGHADFYGIASIASTPATVFAVTTRGYVQKDDAGSRTMAVQLKSGPTTVATPTLVPQVGVWQWAWRTDTTDPNTGAAWTPGAVNIVLCGPTILT